MSWLLVVPLVVAVTMALLTPTILRALPPPVDDPAAQPYRPLATPAFAALAGVLVALAGTIAVGLAPEQAVAWVGLSTAGVLAAMVDARTEYLPRTLVWAGWALTAAGLLGWAGATGDWPGLGRAALGAVAATALFAVFWRFGGGFGFGDVRLAPLIGATTAAVSWTVLAGALILGGLAGVLWGVLWRATGRGRAFPYGPALVAGPYLALLARTLAGA